MQYVDVQGTAVPGFMYGTAWKEDDTARCTRMALDQGFRAIDTANQRKHYHEAGVGEALARVFAEGSVAREALFLQSKYTYERGQDHRLPYDPDADHATQVRQSMDSSLAHLGTAYLDSYVLHGPELARGLTPVDREVWRTMEALVREGKTRFIGVSNTSASQLAELCDLAEIRPAFVQNRCYARHGWDRKTRAVCRERGVVYQGFSLLTANRMEMASQTVKDIARCHGKTLAQVVFRFARALGMIRLTGTSDMVHMREDLACDDFDLSDAEIQAIEHIAG